MPLALDLSAYIALAFCYLFCVWMVWSMMREAGRLRWWRLVVVVALCVLAPWTMVALYIYDEET